MNPELPDNSRAEMEQRLTALLLGELPAAEAAALHRAMEQDGELAKWFARLHHTVGLVRETVTTGAKESEAAPAVPLKLSAVRREKLLAHFKTVTPEEFTSEKRRPRIRVLELAAVLVIIGLLAAMLLPALSKAKSKGQRAHRLDVAEVRLAVDESKSRQAADDAFRNDEPQKTGSAEPALRTRGAAASRERFGYAINSAGAVASDFDGGESESEKLFKKPVGVTPLAAAPAIPAAPIVLPQAAPPLGAAYGDGDLGQGNRPRNLGETVAASKFYRTAPDSVITSGGRGGGSGGNFQPPAVQRAIADDEYWAYGKRGEAKDNLAAGLATTPAVASSQFGAAANGQTETPSVNGTFELGLRRDSGENLGQESARTQLETRTYKVEPEVFRKTLENISGLALNSVGAPANQPSQSIPRASVSGGAVGGGGGGGSEGLRFISAPNSVATVPGAANEFYASLGANLDTKAGESVSYDREDGKLTARVTRENLDRIEQLNEAITAKPPEVNIKARFAESAPDENHSVAHLNYVGTAAAQNKGELTRSLTVTESPPPPASASLLAGGVTTISGRSSVANRENVSDFVSDLENLPRGGRRAGISDQNGLVTDRLVRNGDGIMSESAAYGLNVVGYTNASAKPVDAFGIAIQSEPPRGTSAIALPGVVTAGGLGESQIDQKKAKLGRAGVLVEALDRSENLPALTVVPSQRGQREALPQKQAYLAKQRELRELTDSRQLLARKMNVERVDLSLPKSALVEIVDTAVPAQKKAGVFGGLFSSEYASSARLKVANDKTDIAEISETRGKASASDSYFDNTKYEMIQSEAVLGKVVEKLKLDEAWAKQKGPAAKLDKSAALALLRDRVEVRPVPNTTSVDIQAKSDKPEEAAKIANAVASAYQEWRVERDHQTLTAGARELTKQMTTQDEKIDRLKKELEGLREELKIPDAEAAQGFSMVEQDVVAIRRPATNAPIPQPEISASENNFSTFSLNVSDVSFKLAAASLEQGQLPDVASIRSEEFINAFDYHDPEPAAGAPIAFAWERARYPFAHNRDLLRFSLKTAAAGRAAGRPLNIVLLLDNSGSMERADRVQIIREALHVLAAQLQPQDKLSVVMFARTARLVVDGISGAKAGEVAEQLGGVTPQGGTNLEDAMNLAYQTAARHYFASGLNRVVLLTDGAANLGDVEPESLKQKVETQRKQGIALDCFGIGWEGLNDDLLEVLSRNGDGRYGFINTPEEAATDFVGQLAGALKIAASDVKVQVEFNPKRVTTYRQIGYAKHQLTKEQFRDNTVDAAEIAAQEVGNALYTVEVNAAGQGPLGTVRVRYKVPGTTDYREQAWEVPFTGNVPSLEQASPALRLAASAGAFAEWLVASPFAGEVTPDALLGQLNGVAEGFGADARPKKLEWMIRQAKRLEGK